MAHRDELLWQILFPNADFPMGFPEGGIVGDRGRTAGAFGQIARVFPETTRRVNVVDFDSPDRGLYPWPWHLDDELGVRIPTRGRAVGPQTVAASVPMLAAERIHREIPPEVVERAWKTAHGRPGLVDAAGYYGQDLFEKAGGYGYDTGVGTAPGTYSKVVGRGPSSWAAVPKSSTSFARFLNQMRGKPFRFMPAAGAAMAGGLLLNELLLRGNGDRAV